ncbi:MAG: hypothetical protein ABIJ41_03200 [Candidatus Omnitrophota bacterium]
MKHLDRLLIKKKNATILILALWSLGLLSLFALTLGSIVRQKIMLLSTLERRDQLNLIAASGVKKAVALIQQEFSVNGPEYTAFGKQLRHNNPRAFRQIDLKEGFCKITFDVETVKKNDDYFGVLDEERKININTANASLLKELIKKVLGVDEAKASKLALSIVDWREVNESEMVGFYSDEFYSNLEFPYLIKNNQFEVLDELLLVKGINRNIYDRLSKYLTVYGNGQININTASGVVLAALGLEEAMIQRILAVRRGSDGIEATEDDLVFTNGSQLFLYMLENSLIDPEELRIVPEVLGLLGGQASYYSITSSAKLYRDDSLKVIRCVYNAGQDKIEYWNELDRENN